MPYRDDQDKKSYQRAYDAKRRKTHQAVKVTLTIAQFRKLEAYAKDSGLSVATALLSLALSQLDGIPSLSPTTISALDEVTRLLRASSNNVNQIAHACNLEVGFLNQSKSPQEGAEILTKIHEGLVQLEVLISKKLS